MDKETTKTNMLTDLHTLFRDMNDDELLEVYNDLSGYGYDKDEIDWEQ